MSVAVAGLAAGCSLLSPPRVADISPTLTSATDRRGATFTVEPWPLDNTVAFLCLAEPGDEFTVTHPAPAPAAQCVPLGVEAWGEDLVTARFEVADLPPGLKPAFERSTSPWFLAVAGSRGPLSSSMVLTIAPSPIPSDAGPS